tara:strand:- start:19 stop:390 length:372 start_codon:yes stop_codon:yes gene_type:complete
MTDTKPTMNTDKVLALAREAGAGIGEDDYGDYGIEFDNDSLTRFAALIQQQMEADGWRQCAVGQGTTQFCGMVEELRRDAERYRWLRQMDRCEPWSDLLMSPITRTEDIDEAIDRARSANVHK